MRFIDIDEILKVAKEHKLATDYVTLAYLLPYTLAIERLVRKRAISFNEMEGMAKKDMTRILGDI